MATDLSEELRGALSTQAAVISELVSSFLERPLHEVGLNIGAFELLSAVKAGAGRASQAEIAERMGIRPASLCEALRTVDAKGLIARTDDPNDRRAKRLKLTPKGEKLYQRCLESIAAAEHLLSAGISERDLKVAAKVLEQASLNLSLAIGDG